MKHSTFGKFAVLGMFALAGCYHYVSQDINNADYNRVQATPLFTQVKVGDSVAIILRLVNPIENSAVTSFNISGVGSGIAVHYDAKYRPVFDAKTDTLVPQVDKLQQRYWVVGLAPGQYTFQATPTSVNTGVSGTVTVVVQPATAGAFSKKTAVAGDTIVISAPAGSVFSQTSTVTFPTGTFLIASRAADSTSITIVAGPNMSGPATITSLGVAANPAANKLTLVTTDSLVTPALVQPTISPTTAPAGGTVTLTAAPNTFFAQNSAITITQGPTPPITARAANGSTITFIVGPGDSGAITVTNVGVTNAPTLPLSTLTTSNALTLVPPVTVAPTTVSNAAPAIGVPITVTLGGSLRFLANSHVFIGGVEAGLTAVSADSSTATITPLAFSNGTVTYTNIALSFLNTVPLALNGDKTVTVGAAYAGPTDAGAGSFATATTYTLRKSLVISDNGPLNGPCPANLGGGNFCRYYKVTVPAGSTQGRIVWDGPTSTDLGVYTLNAAGTSAVTAVADDGGTASGTTGDTSAAFTATAGTIGFVVMNFGPAAAVPWFQWRIVQQ